MARSRATELPTLALVGKDDSVRAVAPALRDLSVRLESFGAPAEVPQGFEHIGSVLASLETRSRATRHVEELHALSAVPVFVVIGAEVSPRSVRRLYELGASGVFEWPREGLLLSRFIAEMLALRFVRGRAKRPDVALGRTVRAHLKILPGLSQIPRIEARDGVVSASGEVETLRLKREIERTISGVPGVGALDLSELRVHPDPVPDRKIRQSVRRLLEASPGADVRTLSVAVDAGELIFAGSAESRSDLRRLEELASGIEGVRSVSLRVLVSKHRHRRDRGTSRRLDQILAMVFPGEEVSTAFFSGIAVLTGTTANLRRKREVIDFVADDSAVSRVVDKLEVRS